MAKPNDGTMRGAAFRSVVAFEKPNLAGNWAGADKNSCRPDKLGYMRDRSRTAEDGKEIDEKGFKHLMKDGVWLVPANERPWGWKGMGGLEV